MVLIHPDGVPGLLVQQGRDIGHPEAVSCMPHRDLNSGPLELIPCGGFEQVTKEVRAWSEKVSRSCT